MKKVLANDGVSQAGIDKLQTAGYEVSTEHIAQEDLEKIINEQGIVCLLVRSATTVRKDLIDACPNLKLIGRGGVGMDNIDVEYARSIGRHVFNTPAASSQSVGEMVIGQMFNMSRDIFDSNRQMPRVGSSEFKALKKKYGKGAELRGSTLGIIGFGRIGRATASYALGCGMKVLATDLFENHDAIEVPIGEQIVKIQVPFVGMNALLAQSDYISIHVPKQENGSAVIRTAELQKMKDGVILVNAARGGVIDENDLIEALNSGKVRAASLDVFENEPTPREDILTHPKISLTPHIGAATLEAQARIGEELADQIIKQLG